MRWIVGDIQGCAQELDDLLTRIRFDPGRDELWSVGDLVNRGPDSLATLRLWRDVGGKAVLGNHDAYAVRARSGSMKRKTDTLDDLFGAPDADPFFGMLRALPLLVHLPGGDRVREAWIVHAGLDPRWTDLEAVSRRINAGPHDDAWLESPEVAVATRIRCCTAEGVLNNHSGPPHACPEPFRPWDEFYRGTTLVVHGHWAARGYYRHGKTMGLDSGCVYGGQLTAWCQDEDRIVQVPARVGSR